MGNIRPNNRRSFIFFGFILLSIFLMGLPINGEITASDSFIRHYTKVTLDNGLTVIVKEVHAVPIAAVDIWVGTGAKNETPEEAGISHFFEHMLFKGTTRRKTGEIAREIKAVGGYINAATSLDTTHYYVVVPSDKINLAIDVEADAIMNSTFDPAEIERERKVILEERRLKEDNPQGKLGLLAYQNVFQGTPYANDVLGNETTLTKINHQTFMNYYRKYYIPNNMTVAIVGDVDTDDVLGQVRAAFKDFKPGEKPAAAAFPIPKLNKAVRVEAGMPVDQTYAYFALPGPGMNDKDEPALSVLGAILGGGKSSRFYQQILEEKQLVNEIGSGYSSFQSIGMFVVYAQMQGADISVLEIEVKKIIARIVGQGVTADELATAKALLRSQIAYATESDADIASIIGEYQVGGDVENAVRSIEALNQVSSEDVQRVAKEYLNPNGYVLAVVKPREVKNDAHQ